MNNLIKCCLFSVVLLSGFANAMHLSKIGKNCQFKRAKVYSVRPSKRLFFNKKTATSQKILENVIEAEGKQLSDDWRNFRTENSLILTKMQLDASRDELNEFKAVIERLKAGTQREELLITLQEKISTVACANIKYKIVPKKLKPIIEQIKKDE